MKVNFLRAKLLLHRIIFSFDLILIFIIILSTEISNNNLKEYTDVSHFFLNIYIIIIFILFLGHSLYPRFKPTIIKKYFNFILTNKGKIIIIFLISLIYRYSESLPHYILGLFLFVSSFILFIFEIIFNIEAVRDILKGKGIEIDNNINDNINYNKDEKNKKFSLKNVETIDENNHNNNPSNSSRLEMDINFNK